MSKGPPALGPVKGEPNRDKRARGTDRDRPSSVVTALRKQTPNEGFARTSHPAAHMRHVVRESRAELGKEGFLLRLDLEAIHVHDEAR